MIIMTKAESEISADNLTVFGGILSGPHDLDTSIFLIMIFITSLVVGGNENFSDMVNFSSILIMLGLF